MFGEYLPSGQVCLMVLFSHTVGVVLGKHIHGTLLQCYG